MNVNAEFFWLNRLFSQNDIAGFRKQLAAYHPALDIVPTRIAILGAADEGQRLARLCNSLGITVVKIFDDSPARQASAVEGQRVESSTALDEIDRDVPIIIASHLTVKASHMLKAKGFLYVSPFAALQVLHEDLFPPHMFHAGWFTELLENRDRYAALSTRLGDDLSRITLNAVLAYRQTLSPETLADFVTPIEELYAPPGLFALSNEEIYVDGGAYDGDTIRLFIERTGGRFNKIIGFEPDPDTFTRLTENFTSEARVAPINAGMWSKTDTLSFQNNAGRASILTGDGNVKVKVVSLDEVLNGEPCTYIKFNIEGAELEALRGATQTLQRFAPKLAISAYHRPSDLPDAAKLVDEIAPGYDLFLRQHRAGIVETVLYACPGKDRLRAA